MKRVFLFIVCLLSVVVVPQQTDAQAGILKYFIAAADTRRPIAYLAIGTGQSNDQAGNAATNGSMSADWLLPQSNISIYNFGNNVTGDVVPGHWEAMWPNHNTMGQSLYNGNVQVGYWGPEQGWVHDVYDSIIAGNRSNAPPRSKVFMFKIAEGGIPISYWQPGGTKRAQFDTYLASAITALEDSGYRVVPIGMHWVQGEQNVTDNTLTADYQAALTEFIAHVRGIHSVLADMPVVMQKLGSVQTYYTSLGRARINDAFDSVAVHDTRAYTLNLDDFPSVVTASDGIHYPADSKLTLGREAFKLLKSKGIFSN